jgi:hypothetical protein
MYSLFSLKLISFISRWCGNTITAAWSNVTAQTNTMVVIFRANNYINATTGSPKAGFGATIFFGRLEFLVREYNRNSFFLQMRNRHLPLINL